MYSGMTILLLMWIKINNQVKKKIKKQKRSNSGCKTSSIHNAIKSKVQDRGIEKMSKKEVAFSSSSNTFRDPRFFRLKQKSHKVKVDSRFKSIFNKEEKVTGVDKYGRKKEDDSEAKDLKRFYQVSSSSEGEEKDSEDLDSDASEASSFISVSESSEEDDYLMDKVMSEHPLVNQQVTVGEATKRLALVNLDWDQIRALDIYVLLHGFKPLIGVIKSVKILPSEFGKERLRMESIHGPQISKLVEESSDEEKSVKRSIVEENNRLEAEERGYNDLELRKYQLERLKYFFAVVECDSVETAAAIYAKCDGLEFEKSANVLDFRYIPEDVIFDEGEMREYCDKLPIPGEYRAKPTMVTGALQNTRVKLTWDEDDVERKKALKPLPTKKKGKVDWRDVDMGAYLASATSSSGSEGEAEEYKKRLLGETEDVFGSKGKLERGKELQVSFTSAFELGEDVDKEMTFEVKSSNSKSKQLLEDDEGLLTEKKKNNNKNVAKKQKRKKQKIEIDSSLSTVLLPEREAEAATDKQVVDVDDPRFQALYESHEYALDPTHKSFKRTPGVQAILQKKRQKHNQHK